MILLDTNVISELIRPKPEPRVEAWLARQPSADVFISSITEAELRHGVAQLPRGKRRDALARAVEDMLLHEFRGRILPFDSPAAIAFARIAVARQRAGMPISAFDAQIAAIALVHRAALATRNMTDFRHCGLDLIDPWQADALGA